MRFVCLWITCIRWHRICLVYVPYRLARFFRFLIPVESLVDEINISLHIPGYASPGRAVEYYLA